MLHQQGECGDHGQAKNARRQEFRQTRCSGSQAAGRLCKVMQDVNVTTRSGLHHPTEATPASGATARAPKEFRENSADPEGQWVSCGPLTL